MKLFIIFFILGAGAAYEHKMTIRDVRLSWRNAVAPYLTECLCESQASSDTVEGFFEDGIFANDACFMCNFRCYGTKLNILTPAGNVDVNAWTSAIPFLTTEVATRCSNFTEADLCLKANRMVQCIHANAEAEFAPAGNPGPSNALPNALPKEQFWFK